MILLKLGGGILLLFLGGELAIYATVRLARRWRNRHRLGGRQRRGTEQRNLGRRDGGVLLSRIGLRRQRRLRGGGQGRIRARLGTGAKLR